MIEMKGVCVCVCVCVCVRARQFRLASPRTVQVFDFRSTYASFGHPHDLRGLAITLVELKFAHKSTQQKSTHDDRRLSVYAWNLQLFATCEPAYESLWPCSHRKSARKFWLRRLAWQLVRDRLARSVELRNSCSFCLTFTTGVWLCQSLVPVSLHLYTRVGIRRIP